MVLQLGLGGARHLVLACAGTEPNRRPDRQLPRDIGADPHAVYVCPVSCSRSPTCLFLDMLISLWGSPEPQVHPLCSGPVQKSTGPAFISGHASTLHEQGYATRRTFHWPPICIRILQCVCNSDATELVHYHAHQRRGP